MMKITEGVITRKEEDGNTLLILTGEDGTIESIIVNDIGTEVLNLCKKGFDQNMIIEHMMNTYRVPDNTNLKEDINFFIDSLIERGWIRNG
ncbi:PqqD family protein [Enterococcus hulanensis]|uniref:PqqD family protein n=1 Tax=Enterococcus hulanensis TaxID=2559929 RepID=UPI00288EAC1E|nr:PqqD family protein [Enterococcus hulanensis]MDT2661134.1 PqqD family protein [Enterococcus hulanensis]